MTKIRLIIAGCPKPFIHPFKTIQENAIKSWKYYCDNGSVSNARIVIFGDEEGVSDACTDLGVEHIQDIKRNQYGTPLVSEIIYQIQKIGLEEQIEHPDELVVCSYINCDILIFNDYLENITEFVKEFSSNDLMNCPWLMVGTRWDCNFTFNINFKDPNWSKDVKRKSKTNGYNHGCSGIDYFIFSPKTYDYIYPFALGKFTWDQWLVGNVFRRDSITVDISNTNYVVHQNSPWYQLSRGKGNEITVDKKAMFETDEVEMNISYDFYVKDVYSGTRYETHRNSDDQCIIFVEKKTIPRMYE